jgi:ATP-dependent Clp protease ATP-binding subunit ClpA
MFERFTDRARKVMQLAGEEAQNFNHEYVGTEHILLGLIAEGSGVAAIALKSLDINVQRVRVEVEKIVGVSPDFCTLGRLPQTPRAKKMIEFAIEESRQFNHNYVGTEHLLLGLLRETEGVAAQVLMNLGLRLDTLRKKVLDLLGDQGARPTMSADAFCDDEEIATAEETSSPELRHLPECAREIVAEFDCQIDVIKEAKEKLVGVQAWEKAAAIRDLEYKLRKLRDEFLSHWPKTP